MYIDLPLIHNFPESEGPPPAGVLWQIDADSTAVDGNGALLFGLDSRWGTQTSPPTFDDYVMAKVAAGGPQSQSAISFTYGLNSFASQGYLGGMKDVSAPAFGESRFFGGYIKINFSDYPNGANSCKFNIIGNNLPGNRPIFTWGMHFGADPDFQMRFGIDGGGDTIFGARFGNNTWIQYEIEVFPGNSASDGQAYRKIWTAAHSTTFTYGSPNDSHGGESYSNAERLQFGSCGIGFFMNDSPGTDTLVVSISNTFIADTFQTTIP